MPSMISSGPASAAAMDSGGRGGPSAQVLEFICLFTHDLRRKQKRWEDGRLKYHTFNKRVMVYDERGNFVGDMHWQRDWGFGEGEEVQLERGGIIVQVMECVGRQAQDLSELLEKRAKEKEQRQARVAMRPILSAASPHPPVPGASVHDHFQTRHRPLNHVLGTPTGHHGRAAVPAESPFELRQMADENPDNRTESRPAKRRRCDITPPTKKGYAQALFGATLSLSSAPASSAPPRQPTRPASRPQPSSSPQQEPVPNAGFLLPEGRDISARINSLAGSARLNLAIPVSKMFERARTAELDEEEPPEPAPVFLDRQRPEKPFTRPRVSVQRSEDVANCSTTSFTDGESPTTVQQPTLAPPRPERGAAARNSKLTTATKRGQVEHSAKAALVPKAVVSKPGVSTSQAIILDEDDAPGPREEEGHSPQGQEQVVSKRSAPKPTKQKPPKRNNSRQSVAQPPAAELQAAATRVEDVGETVREERTELRLKPRQKRGLLLLSEKKSRSRQPKRQEAPTRKLPGGGLVGRPTNPVAAEPNSVHAPDTMSPHPMPQEKDPFASSPVEPGHTASDDPPPLQSNSCQSVLGVTGFESESTHLISHHTTAVPNEHREGTVDPLESRKLKETDAGSVNHEAGDLSPSPRARRTRSRRKPAARIREEASETSSSDQEMPSEVVAPEPTVSGPSHSTWKSKDSDEEVSSRLKKKRQKADSEGSDNEEPPRPPARPHFARLSRNVRSREVIGFMPSSSPVIPLPHPARPPLGPDPFDLPLEDAVEISCVSSPTNEQLLVSQEAQPLVSEEPQISLLLVPIPRAASAAPPRRNSPLDDKAGEAKSNGPTAEQTTATPAAPSSLNPSRHRSLMRYASAVLPHQEARMGGRTTTTAAASISLHDTGSTSAPEKESTTTTRPQANSRNRPSAAGVTATAADRPAPPPQLHNPQNQEMRDGLDIGSGVTDNPPPPEDEADTAAVSAAATVSVAAAEPAQQQQQQQRPRLANPATRGRKAALKSDAAGQAPQSVLPPAEPVAVGMMARPAAVMPPSRLDAAAGAAAANERPKKTMRFPGFSSVKGGGPWSREAHDLLESGRPGG